MFGPWTWMTSVDLSAHLDHILLSTTSGCPWVSTGAQPKMITLMALFNPRCLKSILHSTVRVVFHKHISSHFAHVQSSAGQLLLILTSWLTCQASPQNPPPPRAPPQPGIPLLTSAVAALMVYMRTWLIRPPTSSASRGTPTCTAANLDSFTGTPVSAATGPEPHKQEV